MYLPPGVGCVECVSLVVLHSWTDVPPWYSMYPQVLRCWGFSCIIPSIPGGASGVLLKSNCPSSAVYAYMVRVFQKCLIIFNVILSYGISKHHICTGKRVSVLDIRAIKWSFHVLMARSSALTWWIFGSTNWYSIYILFVVLLMDRWCLIIQPMEPWYVLDIKSP